MMLTRHCPPCLRCGDPVIPGCPFVGTQKCVCDSCGLPMILRTDGVSYESSTVTAHPYLNGSPRPGHPMVVLARDEHSSPEH